MKPIEPGLHSDLSWHDYLEADAISRSDILELGRSPLQFQHRRKHRDEEEETDVMLVGKAIHCAVLEPERFEHAYAIGPNSDRRTKEWKAFAESVTDKTLLTANQGKTARSIAGALRERGNVSTLLADPRAKNECSAAWIHKETGVLCKSRMDRLFQSDRLIVDLKSTQGACSPHAFARKISQDSLHLQAAFYTDGIATVLEEKPDLWNWMIVAYEQEPPHACAVYHLEQEAIRKGRAEYEALLRLYVRCVQSGSWEDRSGLILPISLPQWHEADYIGLGI